VSIAEADGVGIIEVARRGPEDLMARLALSLYRQAHQKGDNDG